jgi:hypothetical protein
MTRFTTAVCTALTDGKVTDAWRRAVDYALALQLHVDVPEQYRTSLERIMGAALSPGISEVEAAYEDCVRKVRQALLAMPRAKRPAACHVLIAMWVLGTVDTDDSLINDANLVAEVAQAYQDETSGYWVSV